MPERVVATDRRLKARVVEVDGFRPMACDAHANGDLAGLRLVQGDEAGADLGAQGITPRQAFFVHETNEAACTVAAVFDFAAVGVEYAVAEIGFGVRKIGRASCRGRRRSREAEARGARRKSY